MREFIFYNPDVNEIILKCYIIDNFKVDNIFDNFKLYNYTFSISKQMFHQSLWTNMQEANNYFLKEFNKSYYDLYNMTLPQMLHWKFKNISLWQKNHFKSEYLKMNLLHVTSEKYMKILWRAFRHCLHSNVYYIFKPSSNLYQNTWMERVKLSKERIN